MVNHELANEYKELCLATGELFSNRSYPKNTTDWEVVEKVHYGDNFKAVLYRKGDKYAICFAGTDKKDIRDHIANLSMGLTGDSTQIRNAKKFSEEMMQKYGLNIENTVVIGHSEGGTEATIVGITLGFMTVTFNAYGVWSSKYKDTNNLVINYRDPNDPVSKIHKNVGLTLIVPGKEKAKTRFGCIKAHSISNFGDCTEAIPVENYKKMDKNFLDHISETDISRQDIAMMESSTFAFFEKEIDKRMMNNQIKQNNEGNWVTINGNHVLINK